MSKVPRITFLDDLKRAVVAAESFRYEDFYLDFPERDLKREGAIYQLVGLYPEELMHFNEKYVPCPDGAFREPSRALQEHLISIGYISEYSDACTNIPWKFFHQNSPDISPYDLRCQRLITYFQIKNIAQKKIHEAFDTWDGTGAPDIIDFCEPLQFIEVKFLGDADRKNQQTFRRILKEYLGEEVIVLKLVLPGVGSGGWAKKRKSARADAQLKVDYFPTSQLMAKLHQHIFNCKIYNLKGTITRFEYSQVERYFIDYLEHKRVTPSNLSKAISLSFLNFSKSGSLKFSDDEIIEIAQFLFFKGYLKWWLAPLYLMPFLGVGAGVESFKELLSLIFRWEEVFRTVHMTTPDSSNLSLKSPGFRTRPISLRFSLRDLLSSYEDIKCGQFRSLNESKSTKNLYKSLMPKNWVE